MSAHSFTYLSTDPIEQPKQLDVSHPKKRSKKRRSEKPKITEWIQSIAGILTVFGVIATGILALNGNLGFFGTSKEVRQAETERLATTTLILEEKEKTLLKLDAQIATQQAKLQGYDVEVARRKELEKYVNQVLTGFEKGLNRKLTDSEKINIAATIDSINKLQKGCHVAFNDRIVENNPYFAENLVTLLNAYFDEKYDGVDVILKSKAPDVKDIKFRVYKWGYGIGDPPPPPWIPVESNSIKQKVD